MIPFTEYRLPNGSRHQVSIDRSPEIEALAQKIIDAGFCFEIEILRTGQVSATIADPNEGIDVAITVKKNGPPLLDGIDDMIRKFAVKMEEK